MPRSITQRWLTAGFAVIAAALMIALVTAPSANATHEPAQKVAATGSDIDTVGQDAVVLQEQVRVSSTQDLVLQLAAECSILTELTTGPDDAATGQTNNAFAFGSVRMRIEIDGTPVAVASDDTASSGQDDVEDTEDTGGNDAEIGEVTFCNRAYERTVEDTENDDDGIDEEHDYIRTRTANSFNWLATDIGFNYDDPANGNNIVDIVVYADYDTTTTGNAIAEAFIGSRTLIAEPTNASTHETVDPAGQ
jgi:hypothetical protein